MEGLGATLGSILSCKAGSRRTGARGRRLRKLLSSTVLALATSLVLAQGASAWIFGLFEAPEATNNVALGEIAGVVELVPGERPTDCHVKVDGTPRVARCNADGEFVLFQLDPGTWSLTISVVVPGTGETLTTHTVASSSVGMFTLLPPVVMTYPVAIGGRVAGISASNHGDYFVTVPEMGVAATLSPAGTFVLNGLPPGRHRLEVQKFFGSIAATIGSRAAIDIDVFTGPISIYTGLVVGIGDNGRLPREPAGLLMR